MELLRELTVDQGYLTSRIVSILVLMELLRESICPAETSPNPKRFNPCSNGITTRVERVFHILIRPGPAVSILVLMELLRE